MIAYIKGVLREILDESIIVEVNGIGYHIICPNPFIFQSSLNKEIKVYTYHHVREDAELLYGFQTQDEKKLFMQLISVSGIGPKGAIGIMANIDIAQFVAAIEREDAKYLTSFPGVGKKTSRQMILDLKGKLTSMFSLSTPDMSKDVAVQGSKDQYQEAKAALAALGYTDKEIKTVMPYIQKENIQETDAIIQKALTLFAKK